MNYELWRKNFENRLTSGKDGGKNIVARFFRDTVYNI